MASRIWLERDLPKRRIWTPEQIRVIAENQAGKGLREAAKLYHTIVKQTISVQAPYIVYFGKNGKVTYKALTKATPGAPPRRVSGNLLRRVAIDFNDAKNVHRVFTDVGYGLKHELKNHRWMLPTLVNNLAALGMVAGGVMTVKTTGS